MRFQKTQREAYLNFLRSKYESLKGEILVKATPYYMGIDPTSICQLRCPLCPTGIENESRRVGEPVSLRNRTMLEEDMFYHLIDEVGDNLFLIMFYNWGEPLLNKNLPAYIRKAKDYQITTEIHSNLSLRITDEFMEELLTSGVDVIAASIDGFSQESYSTYRRGGTLELAKGNIQRLAAMRDRLGLKTEIIWNFLVFSFNEHEIEATRSYCQEIGIVFNQREAFINDPDWLPSYRKHEAQNLLQLDASSKKDMVGSDPSAAKKGAPCAWHYGYTMINADGSVSPCCAPWEQSNDFGLIQPGSIGFADIWNNAMFRKSRAAFAGKEAKGLDKVDTLCLRCPFGPGIQNLYSGLDGDLIQQYHQIFDGKDTLLERGFALLDHPDLFVKFYEKNMAALYGGAQPDLPMDDSASLPHNERATRPELYRLSFYGPLKQVIKPISRIAVSLFPPLYYRIKDFERRHLIKS
jgi:MoaA/NifB/PqqE/SkfB family radical SAM enzyme